MKKLFNLITVILLVLLINPNYSTHAQSEPIGPSTFGIDDSSGVSASGIAGYNASTQEEISLSLPKMPRNLEPSLESFTPLALKTELEPSIRGIIGKDNRVRVSNTLAFPNTAIGQIVITFPNKASYVGTAFMYGPKVAMTAGHCVYSKADGGWAKSVTFFPGKNGSLNPLGDYKATWFYTDVKYIASEDGNHDWGMIRFDSNVGGRTGYFGSEWTTSSQKGLSVTVRGYPGEKSGQMWTGIGSITASLTLTTRYNVDTTGGQSGAPVYRYVNGDYRAVAIHNSGNSSFNNGQRIEKSLFNIMHDARKW